MLRSILSKISSILICLLFANSVYAGVLDLRLKVDQIFDVQWNISGGNLNASGFNYIYSSVNYATQSSNTPARWTAAQTADAGSNGRYIAFFNSTTNPGTYGMAVYESDGTLYKIINNTGTFRALANGAIFYNGNGMWGTLITTEAGYANGSSGSWAVTVNYPTNAQLEAYVAPAYSSAQTSTPPPPPTPVYGTSAPTTAQQTRIAAVQNNPTGHKAEVDIIGDNNSIYIQQAGTPSYVNLLVLGLTNSVDIIQNMDPGAHAYNETVIMGNTNDVDLIQTGSGNKTAFINVNGGNNTASVIQKDSGNHFVQLDITGNDHAAAILQEGTGNHSATVVLDGSQPWNFDLTQSGATDQTYTLPHAMSDGSNVSGTCNAVGGCNLSVTQQ